MGEKEKNIDMRETPQWLASCMWPGTEPATVVCALDQESNPQSLGLCAAILTIEQNRPGLTFYFIQICKFV